MRRIGLLDTAPVALGCMNLSHAYGQPPTEQQAIKLLNQALDLGYNMLDTAMLYGAGANEELLAKAVGHRRSEFLLASKGGMFIGENGKKQIDGRPASLRQHCEQSLSRLKTDVIDLYYLHRWDKSVPIEDSVGELSRLVEEGKIREIGLSEVSADTLRKADKVYPIAAVQSEYSLWSRNPEIALLEACNDIGVTFVAFSPLGRGALTGCIRDPDLFEGNDIRRAMPRFSSEYYPDNLKLIDQLFEVAEKVSLPGEPSRQISLAQLSLAWVLAKQPDSIVLPGTTNSTHLVENWHAADFELSAEVVEQLDKIINHQTVKGPRYNSVVQLEIDTEEFES